MDKVFFLEIIINKPQLFEAIIEFNCNLLYNVMIQTAEEMASFTDATPGFDNSFIQKLALRGIALKKERLMETEYCFWDFMEETRRIALLEPETVRRLQLVFGAAINADEIAKVLRRDEVLQLQQIPGQDLYQYSLLRGRYQVGAVRRFFLAQSHSIPLTTRIHWDGRMALEICASSWPSVLQSIFFSQLNFVFSTEDSAVLSQDYPSPVIKGVWDGLKKILLREVAPQWAPIFD